MCNIGKEETPYSTSTQRMPEHLPSDGSGALLNKSDREHLNPEDSVNSGKESGQQTGERELDILH